MRTADTLWPPKVLSAFAITAFFLSGCADKVETAQTQVARWAAGLIARQRRPVSTYATRESSFPSAIRGAFR